MQTEEQNIIRDLPKRRRIGELFPTYHSPSLFLRLWIQQVIPPSQQYHRPRYSNPKPCRWTAWPLRSINTHTHPPSHALPVTPEVHWVRLNAVIQLAGPRTLHGRRPLAISTLLSRTCLPQSPNHPSWRHRSCKNKIFYLTSTHPTKCLLVHSPAYQPANQHAHPPLVVPLLNNYLALLSLLLPPSIHH